MGLIVAKILIAEDDADMAEGISGWLQRHAHSCEVVSDGPSALDRLKFYEYDLVILDWGLPQLSGIELLAEYRKAGGQLPVLMLTGKNQSEEKVAGFDAGADDYLVKPFDPHELNARVRALLRRPASVKDKELQLGNMRFCQTKRQLTVGDQEIRLTSLELRVVEYLLEHHTETVSQDRLLNKVWCSESSATAASVYTLIKGLRKKLEGDENTPVIATVYGLGYQLKLEK